MIIKIATGKDENGNIKWTHLYSEAIRNRLRRDLNLADVPDPAEARKNLGIEAYVAEVADDLYSRLKQYIDKQDIHYYDTLMTYIKNNIETELEAHTERLNEIEKTMVTKEAFDTYFQVSWDKRIPALKKELQGYSDANRVKAEAHSDENLNAAKRYTDGKISALEKSLREYIDGQVSSLSNRIGTLETKVTNMITNLNTNFDAISTDLNYIADTATKWIDYLHGELANSNLSINAINTELDTTIDYFNGDITVSTAVSTMRQAVFYANSQKTKNQIPSSSTRPKYVVTKIA